MCCIALNHLINIQPHQLKHDDGLTEAGTRLFGQDCFPGTPPIAPQYGYFVLIGTAPLWLGLLGHVAAAEPGV